MNVRQVSGLGQVTQPGDYCLPQSGDTSVILSCPACGTTMALKHEIKQRDPLTLSPSVVGPAHTWNSDEQVLGPCGHHFWIVNGVVVDLM